MCGITGLVYRDRSRECDGDVVTAMRDVMVYRGPDDAGLHLDGPVGLGFRRLSIIDLGGGHQPMTDARGTRWIIFNGEIYNYRALREELIARGHTFRSHSDTEVILQLYVERGEKCVEALNGMFAFAIWDAEHQSLFIARDRMGVKPLYYAETPAAFLFASEVKSLLASRLIQAESRPETFSEYLLFRQVAGPQTLFKGIRTLPPGCTMTIRDGRSRIDRYWSPIPSGDRPAIAFDDAVQQFGALLEDSVKLRLVSDVPVGTFCSGGVDSSLVTALAARLKGEPVNTFSVGFDDPDFDESPYALRVSEQYRTIHHRLEVSHAEFAEALPSLVWNNDEPLDFANSIHIFALSRLAKQHVTVVLTGEGSDELFAGYPRYRIPGLAAKYRYVPAPLRRLASLLTRDHRIAKLDRYAAQSDDDVLLYNSSYIARDEVTQIAPRLPAGALAFRRECLGQTASLHLDGAARASLLDQQTFLAGILLRQDKMSMAASIESRVPFMDYRMVEFANRLPTDCKMRLGSGKAVVKAFARTLLPADIVDRKKSGFGVPLGRWFRSNEGLGAQVAGLADRPSADVFDRQALRRFVAEHRDGRRDHTELLWTVLNLCVWREAFRC